MHKATRKLLFSGTVGAILGAIIIVLGLSMIGASNRTAVKPAVVGKVAATPAATGAPVVVSAAPSAVATPMATPKPSENGKFGYAVPAGYRLAKQIMALDAKSAPAGFTTVTLTKGTEKQEADYVKLIEQMAQDRAATEAPQFLPGQTISISVVNKQAQDADAKLAHGAEKFTSAKNLPGTRYVRVEGLFPYDAVYLNRPDGRIVSVQMNYGSADPLFDEAAFMAVINSIT